MKKLLDFIQKHKIWTTVILLTVFFLPLIVVHILFRMSAPADILQSHWSAGELLVYIGGFISALSAAFLGYLALWQNEQIQKEHQKSLEPALSMKLTLVGLKLYLLVQNTGQMPAKDIQIKIKEFQYDERKEPYEKKLFTGKMVENSFDLYPSEIVQDSLGIDFSLLEPDQPPFVKVHLSVSYSINGSEQNQYTRTVILSHGAEKQIRANVQIENPDRTLQHSVQRIANYLDGGSKENSEAAVNKTNTLKKDLKSLLDRQQKKTVKVVVVKPTDQR